MNTKYKETYADICLLVELQMGRNVYHSLALTEIESKVIAMRWGLLPANRRSFSGIGKELGISNSFATFSYHKGISKLTNPIRKKFVYTLLDNWISRIALLKLELVIK